MKYELQATQFCDAVRTLASNPENLDNLEHYLTWHFGEWLEKWANSPEWLAAEMHEFANMII